MNQNCPLCFSLSKYLYENQNDSWNSRRTIFSCALYAYVLCQPRPSEILKGSLLEWVRMCRRKFFISGMAQSEIADNVIQVQMKRKKKLLWKISRWFNQSNCQFLVAWLAFMGDQFLLDFSLDGPFQVMVQVNLSQVHLSKHMFNLKREKIGRLEGSCCTVDEYIPHCNVDPQFKFFFTVDISPDWFSAPVSSGVH